MRELDDPDHIEWPRTFDFAAVRARFNELAGQLERRFGCRCSVDRNVEDASYHGSIRVPATATASAEDVVVRASNFGNLLAVSLGNPGSYDEAEEHELFVEDDRRRISDVVETLGYVVVPNELLWTTYDGVSNLAAHYSPDNPPTWWIRFFDYL